LIGASLREGAQIAAIAGVDVLTMPVKAAEEFRKNPPTSVASKVADDPRVEYASGVRGEDLNAPSLWSVTDAFKRSVEGLLALSFRDVTPDLLQKHFEAAGFGGLLPRWSADDIKTIVADGKIPDYSKWKRRLMSAEVGLDALMNASGLYSFVADQKALDDRIRSLV